jgi:hypothetical protein
MKEVFPIIPASQSPMIFMVAIVALLVGLCAVIGSFVVASRNGRFEVSSAGIRIRGDLYGRLIPTEALILEQALIVDMTRDKDLQLKWRTNGAGLPGYASGWFRLANGEKALAFITDRTRVAYIPTTKGYSVVLSVAHPDELIAALRGMVGR